MRKSPYTDQQIALALQQAEGFVEALDLDAGLPMTAPSRPRPVSDS